MIRILLLSFFAATLAYGAELAPNKNSGKSSLCGLLESIESGEQISLVVSGIYAREHEFQILYDPDQPECESDVQPSTWVEFRPNAAGSAPLDKILKHNRRAYVTFKGTLVGPDKKLEPDDPSVSSLMSYISRRSHRYGHLNSFRTEFVVDEVLEARPVPESLPDNYKIGLKESAAAPKVKSAEVPHYPSWAYHMGISGEVEIEVQVVSGKVTETRVKAGDRLLSDDAVANIKTWTFSPDMSTSFTTKFLYSLEKPPKKENRTPRIELELPFLVRITAPYYAW